MTAQATSHMKIVCRTFAANDNNAAKNLHTLFMKGCQGSRTCCFFFLSFSAVFNALAFRMARQGALRWRHFHPEHRFFFFSFMHRMRAHSGPPIHLSTPAVHSRATRRGGGHTISSGAGGSLTERSQAWAAGTIGRQSWPVPERVFPKNFSIRLRGDGATAGWEEPSHDADALADLPLPGLPGGLS